MLNSVNLVGRLTRSPECRFTQSGVAVTTFDIAVERDFKDAQGNKETDFIPIVTWRKLAEICGNNLDKGRLIAVKGSLQIRSYDTQDGQKRRVAEVIAESVYFLDRSKEPTGSTQQGSDVFPDEDIPF